MARFCEGGDNGCKSPPLLVFNQSGFSGGSEPAVSSSITPYRKLGYFQIDVANISNEVGSVKNVVS